MGDQLLPLSLTERTVHCAWTCSGFFGRRFLADAMDGRGLASRGGAREPLSRENGFTRFIPPDRPDQVPGMWRRYYRRWRVATRERLISGCWR